jgi:hypothetical protein
MGQCRQALTFPPHASPEANNLSSLFLISLCSLDPRIVFTLLAYPDCAISDSCYVLRFMEIFYYSS